jgi:hypothetical protein
MSSRQNKQASNCLLEFDERALNIEMCDMCKLQPERSIQITVRLQFSADGLSQCSQIFCVHPHSIPPPARNLSSSSATTFVWFFLPPFLTFFLRAVRSSTSESSLDHRCPTEPWHAHHPSSIKETSTITYCIPAYLATLAAAGPLAASAPRGALGTLDGGDVGCGTRRTG